ncbi:MAG TPA: SsrA-binding protein SmpB [Bacteroidales bacterium]|jgi:SsrA-binding protein|nr:SsrA-binding protein SmpB [Bacteroidales bacterium]HXK82340.1 SsrA-binding protein SmpB [Bacteroidales bacterium]
MQRLFKNKKAYYQYEFYDTLEAGIQLLGTEIKSIRAGKVSFTDSYCVYKDNELYIRGLHISEYVLGTHNNHDPKRDRKLLLNRKELNQWQKKVNEKSYTIIPVKLYINQKGIAKLEIALARGKKMYDKRESIKQKDVKRDLDRLNKY